MDRSPALAPLADQIISLMAQCIHAYIGKHDGKYHSGKKAGDYADEVANLLSEAKKTIDSVQYTVLAEKYEELLDTFKELEEKLGGRFGRIRYCHDARKLKAKVRKHIRDIKNHTLQRTENLGPGGFNPYLMNNDSAIAFAERLKSEVVRDVSLGYLRRNGHKAGRGLGILQASGLGIANAVMMTEPEAHHPSSLLSELRREPIEDGYEMISPMQDVGWDIPNEFDIHEAENFSMPPPTYPVPRPRVPVPEASMPPRPFSGMPQPQPQHYSRPFSGMPQPQPYPGPFGGMPQPHHYPPFDHTRRNC